jgi:DNA-binding transcriptional regulator GbsR (MarR family)
MLLKLVAEQAMGDPLDDCKNLLVRRWGEMGGYWGINRTMAEIHALLFVSGQPLCTDDIMAQLHVSRGNASMNLRGLVDWGLIRRVHKFGDRKEYFEADTDVWHMFETILRERRRREVEPILETLERCRQMIPGAGRGTEAPSPEETRAFARRLDELQRFLATTSTLFELVLQYGDAGVATLMQFAEAAARPPEPSAVSGTAKPSSATGAGLAKTKERKARAKKVP